MPSSSRSKVYNQTTTGRCGVRVSGGHLCEAEAPTEPTGETQRPLHLWYILAIQTPQQIIIYTRNFTITLK